MPDGKYRHFIILLTALVYLASFTSASTTQGEAVVFLSNAEEDYPHADKLHNVLDSEYNDEHDDSFAIMDYTDDGLAVNMADDSRNFGRWYDNSNQCELLVFDQDTFASDDGEVNYWKGAMVEYNGEFPSSGDSNFAGKTFDDSNGPGDPKTASHLFDKLTGTGFNGQSADLHTGNMELIRGANNWKLTGDLLCGDHDNNGEVEWKVCTSSTDEDTVTIDGTTYGCDGSNSDWGSDQPNADFTVDDSNGDGVYSLEEELTFTSSSDADTFKWDWTDDGGSYDETLSSSETTHSYSSGTGKTIELKVKNEYGISDTTTQTITLNDECIYGESIEDGGGFSTIYRQYGEPEDVTDFTIRHNSASCPQPDEMNFEVCDHDLGEEFIDMEDDQYNISFEIPQEVPCTWKRFNATGDYSGHEINLTKTDGTNIPHEDEELIVRSKGDTESPHKGYYIYVEQNVHTDPTTFEGMWLTNETWYDCDGSCGLTAYNRFPDKGTENDQNVPKGAKFLVEQEDESVSDGSRHEAGAYHAEYGAVIENQTGDSIGDYTSSPVTSAEQENCGNGECWWLGNDYDDLQSVLNEQFANDLTEGFTNPAVIY